MAKYSLKQKARTSISIEKEDLAFLKWYCKKKKTYISQILRDKANLLRQEVGSEYQKELQSKMAFKAQLEDDPDMEEMFAEDLYAYDDEEVNWMNAEFGYGEDDDYNPED